MYLILLLVGVVLAAAGVAMMRYAVPIEEFSGVALFVSGVVAIVGALVIGCAGGRGAQPRADRRAARDPAAAAAAGRRGRARRSGSARLRAGRLRRPLRAAARPSLLGWFGRGSAPAPVARRRNRPRRLTPEPPQRRRSISRRSPASRSRAPPAPPVPAAAGPCAARAPQSRPRRQNGAANTVYRSGVIDGMAYTLFMDGSIQAELPQGTVKFAIIDELQKYLLGNRQ